MPNEPTTGPNNQKAQCPPPSTNLTFGTALAAAKCGFLIAREGWNGKGMFVFMRPADELPVDTIVFQVKSLPRAVKDWFASQTNPSLPYRLDGETLIKFTAYLCMKAADGSIVNGWLASQTDMLATDWCILKIEQSAAPAASL